MTLHFGVDSDNVVTTRFIAQVAAMSGRVPEFWGRYIGGNTHVGTPLSASEASVIHAKAIRILPIYNVVLSHEPAGTLENAKAHAARAVHSARALNIPDDNSVCIYADLEYWVTSKNWIDGWEEGITSAGYLAGFYGSLALQSFAPAYCAAYANAPEHFARVLLFGNQPSYYPTKTNVQASYEMSIGAAVPSCNPAGAAIWQYVLSALSGTVDLNMATDIGFESMW